VQPLAPSINVSTQSIVLYLRIAHSPVSGPFGLGILFVDLADLGHAALQDLARLALRIRYTRRLIGFHLGDLGAIPPALSLPRSAASDECTNRNGGGIASPSHQCCRHTHVLASRRVTRPGRVTSTPPFLPFTQRSSSAQPPA